MSVPWESEEERRALSPLALTRDFSAERLCKLLRNGKTVSCGGLAGRGSVLETGAPLEQLGLI